MEIKLSPEDKKTLKVFSMYLQSYGSKVGKYSIDVSTDYEVYWDYARWYGDSTRMSIDSYDAVDKLLEKIFFQNEDLFLQEFDSDSTGSIVFVVNCNDNTLTFKSEVRKIETEYEGDEIDFEEFLDREDYQDLKEWVESVKDWKHGKIDYEGSGDSGYIESNIYLGGKEWSDYPSSLEEWMYGKLSLYGGWEINEGSRGSFTFDFINQKVTHEHGNNYETEDVFQIPLVVNF